MKNFYINNSFFFALIGLMVLFCAAFAFPVLYSLAWYLLLILAVFFGIDCLLLFLVDDGIEAERITTEKLSNGDENPIRVNIKNYYSFPINVKVIDEIPYQFQVRNFEIKKSVKPNSFIDFQYFLKPVTRGEYFFGTLNVYVATPLRLVSKRYRFA